MNKDKIIIRELTAAGVRLDVTLPEESAAEFDAIVKNTLNFVPNVQSYNHAKVFCADLNRGPNTIVLEDEKLEVSESASSAQLGRDAADIASRLMEKAMNKVGIFSVHGACVSFGRDAILLVGESGSGKTTAALNMCIKDHDISFVTGNRTLTSGNSVVGGVLSVNVRIGSIIGELKGLISEEVERKLLVPGRSWEDRIYLPPESLNIKINGNYPLNLTAIAVVKKLPNNLSAEFCDVGDRNAIYQLYDDVSRWADRKPYAAGSLMHYPELFNLEDKQHRLSQIMAMLDGTKFLYVNGRLDDITDYLIKLLRDKQLE